VVWDAAVARFRHGIREVPTERWDVAMFADEDPTRQGKMTPRRGGFLDGVDRFDATSFGIHLPCQSLRAGESTMAVCT
jgi:acyl transferase domain-containing protein